MATSRADLSMRYSSSPDLSDPPSGLSETTSPVQRANARANELTILDSSAYRYDVTGQPVLTKDGVPRRKPGPKPGTKLGKRNSNNNAEGADAKVRKPRKPRDPNAPATSRKRKLDKADPDSSDLHIEDRSVSIGAGPPRQTKLTDMSANLGRLEPMAPQPLKREGSQGQPRVSNMSSILNADPEPQPQPNTTPRSGGTNYDVARPSYDPVRGTMVSHHSYSNPLASPRAPTNAINRASASPSIASLVDPPVHNIISPIPSQTTFAQSNTQQSQHRPDSNSVPASPQPFRTPKDFAPPPPAAPKSAISEAKKDTAPTITRAQIEIRPSSITSIAAASKRTPPKNHSHASGSPRLGAQKNGLEMPGDERSILDFGKSGSAVTTPSIVLHIPLTGENNKYVNFMRMAEDQYGWDALHPRQAEAKARKARIAAASAALAQQEAGPEGDEMSVDESDNDDSNIEMGGMSGLDKPDGKIKKKKRHFKEDEYDKEDDFVDDSEMLWEEQAAASRDGFFVYSGPLVPEVEKPEPGRGEGRPARGRGSRGGRGGAGRGTGTGRGRGGGPGSRGGVVRKPRMTKADKAQMDREKAEREAAFLKSTNGGGNYNVLHPASPQFAGL
ncbi:hypothetical protein G7054_g9447 [Neopestalotiopsis clavispora]|nr:hypothetical protein E8E14_009637 [Neopestalotiopsis sp. 37M]KAF7530839.1 hypothetical protein G7054_g9447 [Neopestalotiopsis clavispora]